MDEFMFLEAYKQGIALADSVRLSGGAGSNEPVSEPRGGALLRIVHELESTAEQPTNGLTSVSRQQSSQQ